MFPFAGEEKDKRGDFNEKMELKNMVISTP